MRASSPRFCDLLASASSLAGARPAEADGKAVELDGVPLGLKVVAEGPAAAIALLKAELGSMVAGAIAAAVGVSTF